MRNRQFLCMAAAAVLVFSVAVSADSSGSSAFEEPYDGFIQDMARMETLPDIGEPDMLPAIPDDVDTGGGNDIPEFPDFTASPYVALGEYDGLHYEAEAVTVTDEEVEEEFASRLENEDSLYERVKEGEVQDGDIVLVDYTAYDENGDEADSAEGYRVHIGSFEFPEELENALKGAAVGTPVSVTLSAENYGLDSDLRFEMCARAVLKAKGVTDEDISTITDGEFPDVNSYKENIRRELEEAAKEEQSYGISAALLDEVVSGSSVHDVPDDIRAYFLEEAEYRYNSYAESAGVTLDEAIEQVEGEKVSLGEIADRNMETALVTMAIAEKEKLVPDEKTLLQKREELAEEFGYDSAEELISTYNESLVDYNVLYYAAVDFIYSHADISYADASAD